MKQIRTISLLLLLMLVGTILAACGGQAQPTPANPATSQPTAGTGGQPTADATTPITGTQEQPTDAATPAGSGQPAGEGQTLVVMTHDSFNISTEVLSDFQRLTGANVQILKSGDAGAALNKAILSKESPLADVFFGVDNTFFSRAIEADIFEAYEPQGIEAISPELRLDPESRLVPIDYGFVNINYDRKAFEQGGLPLPQTLRDLTRPEYKGKLVVENPATSSPGLAFLMVTIATFGETGDYTWLDFWRELRANEVLVADGWENAYYGSFSGATGAQGTYPLVVSYATSPAAEVFFSEGNMQEPPTGNLLPPNGAFRQIEFAGILKGARNPELARQWMDFMLSQRFQEDIPLNMFVYPVLPSAQLPEVFTQFAAVPAEPAVIDPETIAGKREQWIREWTEAVVR